MLPACAAASVGINPQILFVDFHIQVLFDIRHNVQRHKRGLPLSLGIKGRNTNQPVHALLRFQVTVGIDTIYLEGHGLDACLVPVQIIEHLYGKALALRPTGIHAVEHTAPVAALRAARSRVQLQNRVAFVILTRQQSSNAYLLKRVRKESKFLLYLRYQGGIVFLVAHLNQGLNILVTGFQLMIGLAGILHVFQFLHQLVGAFRIIPEIGCLHLSLKLFNPLLLGS